MTTGNAIETGRYDDVLSIPIEALGSEDGIPFVYRRDGGGVRKQEVVTGPMGEDQVVIERGLEVDDEVLLVPPADAGTLDLERLPDSPVRATPPAPPDSARHTGG